MIALIVPASLPLVFWRCCPFCAGVAIVCGVVYHIVHGLVHASSTRSKTPANQLHDASTTRAKRLCKYCKMNPSKGGDVVQTDEGIAQFYLNPMVKKPITRGKGAGVNVQAKSLTTYFADMTFCNYPQLLLIFPEHQTQVETMGKKTT
jgi:hypothetical protein